MHKLTVLLKASSNFENSMHWHNKIGIKFLWNWLLQGYEGSVSHNSQPKPFCWNIEAQGLDTAVFNFSSIPEDVAEYALRKAQECKESKAFLPLAGGNNVLVQDVYPIADLPHLHNSITLMTTTGMICRSHRDKSRFLTCYKNGEKWKERVIDKLVERTNMFMGTSFSSNNVSIDHASSRGMYFTEYYDHIYGCEQVTFVLRGPDEVLQTAFYGGVGSRNPSGFGMVAFC